MYSALAELLAGTVPDGASDLGVEFALSYNAELQAYAKHASIYRDCICEQCFKHITCTCDCADAKVKRVRSLWPRMLYTAPVLTPAESLNNSRIYEVRETVDTLYGRTLHYDSIIGEFDGVYIGIKDRNRIDRLLFAPGSDGERAYRTPDGVVHRIPYWNGTDKMDNDAQHEYYRANVGFHDKLWLDRLNGDPPIVMGGRDLILSEIRGVHIICVPWKMLPSEQDKPQICAERRHGLHFRFSCGDNITFAGKNHIVFQRMDQAPIVVKVPVVFDLTKRKRIYVYDPRRKLLSWHADSSDGQYCCSVRFDQKIIESILAIGGLPINIASTVYKLI